MNQFNYEFKELTKDVNHTMKTYIHEMLTDYYEDMNKNISLAKEPFLTEILVATRNEATLEKKYTASDILTILENLQENLQEKLQYNI